MKQEAKRYSKILYFIKNPTMREYARKYSEKDRPQKSKPERRYPYNCVSRHLPMAGISGNSSDLLLPCGFKNGESWYALKKAWRGYRIAKVQEDKILMREYATRIQTLEEQLGVPTASFPNLGLLGDIFFLYDKDKEMELRTQYMHDNIVCDRYDVENIQELIDNGEAKEFDNVKQVRNYMRKEHYQNLVDSMMHWAFHESTQTIVRKTRQRWNARKKVQDELRHIKQELGALRMSHLDKPEQNRIKRRKEYLQQQKILKESELKAIETIQIVKTDEGYKYVKEIISNNMREKIKYDYEPKYYLTDLKGRRLANYKEEQVTGVAQDPYFYRLYLEDKEWEKIYNK